MRDLVRGDREDALHVADGGDLRIRQQDVFEREDRAPVLHRAEELAAARRGDVVQLRQRIRHAEVVVVFLQHQPRCLQRARGLVDLAAGGDHADFGAVDGVGGAFEVAEGEEQQVGRHLRRGLEADQALAARQVVALRHRHVADRHLRRRHGGDQVEGRLVVRLVPGRHEAARIRRLELGEQRTLLAGLAVVVQREQAVGLGVDLAAVIHRQQVAADRQRLVEGEGGGLRGGVDAGFRLQVLAVGATQLHIGEAHVDRVEHDPVGRLQHVDVDPHLAVEGQFLRIGHDLDVVVGRAHVAWQLGDGLHGRRRSRARAFGRRLRRCERSGRAQREDDGGSHQVATHGESSMMERRGHRCPANRRSSRPPRPQDTAGSHGAIRRAGPRRSPERHIDPVWQTPAPGGHRCSGARLARNAEGRHKIKGFLHRIIG